MSRPVSIRTLLMPLAWLLTAIAAVYGVTRALPWPEILGGWGVVCLNAFLAWAGPRLIRAKDPASLPPRLLAVQFLRAGLTAAVIFFPIRLDFLDATAFLTATFSGYFCWMAGHVLALHRNSLHGM